MGYDLRITRALDWAENTGLEVGVDEWLAIAAADPDLSRYPALGPLAVRFKARACLDWFEGNVVTTDPDHATVAKMIAIAEELSAIVQGDDGEFYDSASQWSRRAGRVRRESAASARDVGS